jgi:transposase
MNSILHVGLDVDDKMFHGGAISLETGEVLEFRSKPTLGALLKKLKKLQANGYELKICYEATYLGYNLCRDLREQLFSCEIVAPSLIPEMASARVKTDRLDANKLAEYYAKGLLTPIYIPDKKDEQVRDLVRARGFLVDQRKSLKRHILSTCRRYRLDYKRERKARNYWTATHIDWLADSVDKLEEVTKTMFDVLLYQLERMNEAIAEYDRAIEKISEQKRYKAKKDALICFRGIGTLSAMTLITEIGDIRRFSHPAKLTSYVGLDIREYTTGGKEKKYGITKMGNRRIRTVAIESCQRLTSSSRPNKRLRLARQGQEVKIIDVADRCMARLSKKSSRMHYAGKHPNKIKVACAREMLGFIWEALRLVA